MSQNLHRQHITDLLVACWVERRTFCERERFRLEHKPWRAKEHSYKLYKYDFLLEKTEANSNTSFTIEIA